jgi:hypothetical protein
MEILLIIIGVVLLAIYLIVGTMVFVNAMIASSMSAEFGWPGGGVFEALVVAITWPILLPLSYVLDWWDERKSNDWSDLQ